MNYLDALLIIVFLVFLVVLYLKVIREYISLSGILAKLTHQDMHKTKYSQVKHELKNEFEKLKKEKKECEEILKEAKKRYMKHTIDESTYKEIVKENESKMIQIDLKLKKFDNYI